MKKKVSFDEMFDKAIGVGTKLALVNAELTILKIADQYTKAAFAATGKGQGVTATYQEGGAEAAKACANAVRGLIEKALKS